MIRSKPTAVKQVAVTVDGDMHRGTYFVQGPLMHVQSPLGTKSIQVGGTPPETLAKLLLSEIVRSHAGHGRGH